MKKNKVLVTKSFRETKDLGFEYSQKLKPGDKIFLYGDLGSGKTTFVQGLAKGLGIKRRIISPTFIIIRRYKVQSLKLKVKSYSAKFKVLKQINLYHIDLYRIEDKKDIESLGVEEIIEDRESIVVIEWGERMGNMLPKKRIDIRFVYVSDNKRRIEFL